MRHDREPRRARAPRLLDPERFPAALETSVGGTTTVGTCLLPRLPARFRDRHHTIECDIVVGNNGQIVKRLLDGELGLAIVAGQPGAPQLRTETVLDERLLLLAAPDHPLTRPETPGPVTPADPAGERFLLREPGSQTRDLQEAALIGWDLADMARADLEGPETIKQSVAASLGISLISERAIDAEVRDGRLAVVGRESFVTRDEAVALVQRIMDADYADDSEVGAWLDAIDPTSPGLVVTHRR